MCLVVSGRKLFIFKYFSPVLWQLGRLADFRPKHFQLEGGSMSLSSQSFLGAPVHMVFHLSHRPDVSPSSRATPPVNTTVQDGEEAPFSDQDDPNGELHRFRKTPDGRRHSSSTNPVSSKHDKKRQGPVWPT